MAMTGRLSMSSAYGEAEVAAHAMRVGSGGAPGHAVSPAGKRPTEQQRHRFPVIAKPGGETRDRHRRMVCHARHSGHCDLGPCRCADHGLIEAQFDLRRRCDRGIGCRGRRHELRMRAGDLRHDEPQSCNGNGKAGQTHQLSPWKWLSGRDTRPGTASLKLGWFNFSEGSGDMAAYRITRPRETHHVRS